MKTITVPAQIAAVNQVTAFVDALLEDADCPMKAQMLLDVAIDEIFSNICNYSGSPDAEISCQVLDGLCTLRFSDRGAAYDPLGKADPDVTLTAEEREIGGLGIFMVKKTMDAVEYQRLADRNVLTVRKQLR